MGYEIHRAEVERLLAALAKIRAICAETHAGQERAYTALSRIDQIARRGLWIGE